MDTYCRQFLYNDHVFDPWYGVPTTANYVITSTIAAPALVQMDVPVLAAHMFAFYFGIVADVTPPVALAAYAGAGISGADPMKTGLQQQNWQ